MNKQELPVAATLYQRVKEAKEIDRITSQILHAYNMNLTSITIRVSSEGLMPATQQELKNKGYRWSHSRYLLRMDNSSSYVREDITIHWTPGKPGIIQNEYPGGYDGRYD